VLRLGLFPHYGERSFFPLSLRNFFHHGLQWGQNEKNYRERELSKNLCIATWVDGTLGHLVTFSSSLLVCLGRLDLVEGPLLLYLFLLMFEVFARRGEKRACCVRARKRILMGAGYFDCSFVHTGGYLDTFTRGPPGLLLLHGGLDMDVCTRFYRAVLGG